MGFIILIVLFFIGIIVLGVNGGKWFPPKYHTTYICNMDGEVVDMYEDHTRPIRQQTQSELDYDDFYDDDDDLFDDEEDDDDWDDDDDDDWDNEDDDDETNEIVNTETSITFTDNKIVKAKTVINNVSLDTQGYDMAAYVNGNVYRFNDGEEPPEVLKMIEDLKKENKKKHEAIEAMAKANTEYFNREMERLKKEEERLKNIPDGSLRSRYRFFDDDDFDEDDCDRIIYVDGYSSHKSYQEPTQQNNSERRQYDSTVPLGCRLLHDLDDNYDRM